MAPGKVFLARIQIEQVRSQSEHSWIMQQAPKTSTYITYRTGWRAFCFSPPSGKIANAKGPGKHDCNRIAIMFKKDTSLKKTVCSIKKVLMTKNLKIP